MKSKYSLSALLSLILPAISFFLLLLTLGGINFTVFTAVTLFVFLPIGSIILAILTIKRKKEYLTKTETVMIRLGIILSVVAIICFFWFQSL